MDTATPIIYLVRHGQTDWNAHRRLQGQTEIPMNDYGRSQVIANAHKLAAVMDDPDIFNYVSSPISRARETLQILQQTLGLPADNIQIDDRLKELHYGEFASHTWEELREIRPDDVMQRFDNSWDYVIPRGECYAQLSRRVLNWLAEIEQDTVVAAHAGVSRVLQAHFSQHPHRNEVAFLQAPQDRILVIKDEQISWL
ncbi:MAG: histidine phosphatase family protein [Hyphomicrobiaceae bacterium]|nr:histidine phosphatase family protein [Hyphomicrobiaceae bacterium]